MLRRIRSLVGGGRGEHVLYECRLCGSNVDASVDECPECGTGEIAHIVL